MKSKIIILSILVSLSLLFSCEKESFRETARGIIISFPPSGDSAPRLVKIDVVEEDIFRIVFLDKDHARPLDFEARPDPMIRYNGIKTSIQL